MDPFQRRGPLEVFREPGEDHLLPRLQCLEDEGAGAHGTEAVVLAQSFDRFLAHDLPLVEVRHLMEEVHVRALELDRDGV
jgi:hypothetical protein